MSRRFGICVVLSSILCSAIFHASVSACQVKAFPVVVLHGYQSTFQDGWGSRGVDKLVNPLYPNCSEANFRISEALSNIAGSDSTWNHHFFAIKFTDTTRDIAESAAELDRLINGTAEHEGIRQVWSRNHPLPFPKPEDVKVIVLAHSMGGLVAREYMRLRAGDHGIARVVTVATPHTGVHWLEVEEVLVALAALGGLLVAAGALFFPPLVPLCQYG